MLSNPPVHYTDEKLSKRVQRGGISAYIDYFFSDRCGEVRIPSRKIKVVLKGTLTGHSLFLWDDKYEREHVGRASPDYKRALGKALIFAFGSTEVHPVYGGDLPRYLQHGG